jgi:hypothetical protein
MVVRPAQSISVSTAGVVGGGDSGAIARMAAGIGATSPC